MKAQEISAIIKAQDACIAAPEAAIESLLTDSRSLASPQGTLFFAIPTQRNTGVRYIEELYQAGVRSFVVPAGTKINHSDANVWQVRDVVQALQEMASAHRSRYNIPVVGITGSNGKTVVKDWLQQLLSPDHHVVASPKSYNSQIGVPLSVWQMDASHTIALFEAGISKPGEMASLQRIIRPTIGLLTNIGQAHDENFGSREEKLAEKMRLFEGCKAVICSGDRFPRTPQMFTWGKDERNDVRLLEVVAGEESTAFTVLYEGQKSQYTLPFADHASQENAMHCIALMLYLGYRPEVIAPRLAQLAPVEMRLEIDEAVHNCMLINDSYSLDLGSLTIALDFLAQQRRHRERTLILSDILQSGIDEKRLYAQVADLLRQKGVHRLIAVGPALTRQQELFKGLQAAFYPTTDALLAQIEQLNLHDQAILLKGARVFRFERIASMLILQTHQTVLEVNLSALVHNLNYYRSRLAPTTRLMAMVKASSYGAGTVEIASALQHSRVDYLTVAYADEGVTLRQGDISLPIMVMNPEPASFDDIVRHHLEPDIYSFHILDLFARHLTNGGSHRPTPFPIHIEFDTGMHRLGFSGDDVEGLVRRLNELKEVVQVRSIFSHLACSEDPAMDDFTRGQIARLRQWSDALKAGLEGSDPMVHILNSSGISRFPEAQMDMVRLGIGLYGIAPEPEVQRQLRQVSRLVCRISQIKDIPAGDTVGYNCRWRAERPSRIAILTIGYADGLHRGLGNGHGRVLVGGCEAPLIGAVCMDMCFVDVTDIPCAEGDRAVLFGDSDLLQRNAEAAGTIPYELLTAVAPRVKRIYYREE